VCVQFSFTTALGPRRTHSYYYTPASLSKCVPRWSCSLCSTSRTSALDCCGISCLLLFLSRFNTIHSFSCIAHIQHTHIPRTQTRCDYLIVVFTAECVCWRILYSRVLYKRAICLFTNDDVLFVFADFRSDCESQLLSETGQ